MVFFDTIVPIFVMFSLILHRCLPTPYYKLNIFYEGLPMSELFAPFFLVLALSADIFAASFSYGTDHVTIPLVSRILIAGISTVVLCIALIIGGLFRPYLPMTTARILAAGILFCLGIRQLLAAPAEKAAKECNRTEPQILSVREAFALGSILAIDSGVAGASAGLSDFSAPVLLGFSLLLGLLAIQGGLWIGKFASQKTHLDFSKSSGLLLLVLGVSCLF